MIHIYIYICIYIYISYLYTYTYIYIFMNIHVLMLILTHHFLRPTDCRLGCPQRQPHRRDPRLCTECWMGWPSSRRCLACTTPLHILLSRSRCHQLTRKSWKAITLNHMYPAKPAVLRVWMVHTKQSTPLAPIFHTQLRNAACMRSAFQNGCQPRSTFAI